MAAVRRPHVFGRPQQLTTTNQLRHVVNESYISFRSLSVVSVEIVLGSFKDQYIVFISNTCLVSCLSGALQSSRSERSVVISDPVIGAGRTSNTARSSQNYPHGDSAPTSLVLLTRNNMSDFRAERAWTGAISSSPSIMNLSPLDMV